MGNLLNYGHMLITPWPLYPGEEEHTKQLRELLTSFWGCNKRNKMEKLLREEDFVVFYIMLAIVPCGKMRLK